MDEVGALILAAGGSQRLGRPKQLIDWGGVPLLEHVVRSTATWPVASVTVVLGAAADEVLDVVDFGVATVLINEDWEEGMAASLRVGLDSMSRTSRIEYALVVLGDQPGISSELVARLVDARRKARAIVPKYRYVWGNPVLLDKWIWPRVMAMEGDTGAKQLLQAHPEWVHEIWVDKLPPRDVDTETDVAELRPKT